MTPVTASIMNRMVQETDMARRRCADNLVPAMGSSMYVINACIQKYKVPQPKQQKAPMKWTMRTLVS